MEKNNKKITEKFKGAGKTAAINTKLYSAKMYKKSPALVWVVLLLAIGGGAFAYLKNNETKKETHLVSRGPIEEVVKVTGKIKASTDADLSFEKGGTVNAVYVKEGQKVKAGQTLVTLSGGTDYGQVLEAQAQVAAAQAQLDLLKNGTRREDLALGEAGVTAANTELENVYATIGDSVRNSYNSASDAIRYKTQNFFTGTQSSGYRTVLSTCNSQLENSAGIQRKQVELDLIAWSKINTSTLSNAEKESVILQVQTYIDRTSSLIETMNSIVNAPCVSNDTSLDSYRASISQARNSLSAAQAEITQKKNALSSAKSNIEKAKSSLGVTSANTEPEKIRAQQAALSQAYARLYQARAASSKNVLRAPSSGTITKVDITSGEYASPGKSVIRLIGNGGFTVEADVTESDIARILLENEAKIIVPAIDSKTEFSGKVVSIDPAEQSSEGNPLYRILIDLENNDARIKSGMTAEVTIVTSIVEDLLKIPTRFITKIKGVSSVNVVIDSKTLETEERNIETGRRGTDGNIEVTKGLEESELVVLPKAAETATK